MRLLLVSATEFEIQDTIKFLSDQSKDFKFSCDILITGIGAVNLVYNLTKQIAAYQPGLIIQGGIAGSFDKRDVSEIFAVEKEFFSDLGVVENGEYRDVFDMGLSQPSAGPFYEKALINQRLSKWNKTDLPVVNSIGVSEITTSAERIETLKEKYNVQIESMEGAAFHYVCLREQIEFIQIRSVSNLIGVRDKSKWKMSEAISKLNIALQDLISKLS